MRTPSIRKLPGIACALGMCLTITFGLSSCAPPFPGQGEVPPEEGSEIRGLEWSDIDILYRTLQFGLDVSVGGYNRFFEEMVLVRVEEVPAGEGGMRSAEEPAREFGPWRSSHRNEDATDAPADGSIAEWYENYFITHDWSEYGRAILSMNVGDRVEIDGKTMVVERVFDYPKSSYYGEIIQLAGDEGIVLQTCVPGRDMNRHVCGSLVLGE